MILKKLCFSSINIPLLNIKNTKQFIQRNQFKIYTKHFQCLSRGKAGIPYNNSARQVLPLLHSGTMAFSRSVNNFPQGYTLMWWVVQGLDTHKGSLIPVFATTCQAWKRKIRARCRVERELKVPPAAVLFLASFRLNVSTSVSICKMES